MFERKTWGEKVFLIVDIFLMLVLTALIIVPLFSVVMSSFVGADEIARRGQFIMIPEKLTTASYEIMLGAGSNMWRSYRNTLIVVICGTALSLALTISMAYPLSKKDLKGRLPILAMVFFTMLFNGGMVANYMWVKKLNFLNTYFALIIPYAMTAWNLLLMRNFFYSIPVALEEAAQLDGASQMRTLISIVLPLSLPSITTIGLFYGVSYWNAWFPGEMYLTKTELLPVQNLLRTIVNEANAALMDGDLVNIDDATQMPAAQTVKSAAIVVGTLPIVCVYPFIQKYFVKGVMVGSVKG